MMTCRVVLRVEIPSIQRGCDFSASVADFDKFRLKKAGCQINYSRVKKCQSQVQSISYTGASSYVHVWESVYLCALLNISSKGFDGAIILKTPSWIKR
jgi:hypothetical protein